MGVLDDVIIYCFLYFLNVCGVIEGGCLLPAVRTAGVSFATGAPPFTNTADESNDFIFAFALQSLILWQAGPRPRGGDGWGGVGMRRGAALLAVACGGSSGG